MHTQKNDQIMFAFYRWDAKIKSCKEQDLFDICRQSQSLIRQLLNLVLKFIWWISTAPTTGTFPALIWVKRADSVCRLLLRSVHPKSLICH